MKRITIYEADMSSPHRYLDPAGGDEPHPKAGEPDPENAGKVFPATRPKTLGKFFGRVEGSPDTELPPHLYDALREASDLLEEAAIAADEAELAAKTADVVARRAAFDART